ncbi:hypothetical protein BDV23DRAFT_169020 [Aspergillus alliaceus]|uniref:Carboxylic ester hydrolase n=1 Tax=Petromyces alliaceus TaxID=209559 RepID=A0A5N7CM85_PETAA|nr:hypothetical protein BDV23DRAFT_169020 [Aspergillus alliaceus]
MPSHGPYMWLCFNLLDTVSGINCWIEMLNDSQDTHSKSRPLSVAEQVALQSQVSGSLGTSCVWEILSCVLGVVSLVAIIVVLYDYNGKPMADWPYGVTLNAVISILTTLMKAAMAFPITEALSQLRWPWSSQGNKLSDLALLDAASRGAIGAALVLMRCIPSAAGYGVLPQVSATECALYFCIDTYEATVKDGDFNERPVSSATFSNLSSISVTENFALIPETCYVNSTQNKGPSQCTYPVNWLSRLALVNSLTPLLNVPGEFYMSNQVPWSSDIVHALYGQQGNLTNITTVFNSLTSTLTTHARAQVCKATVKGMTGTVEPFTRNQYIWKSSPLALLFSDLAVEATHSFRTSPSLSGMREASRKMKVWLEITPEGVKLKGIPR